VFEKLFLPPKMEQAEHNGVACPKCGKTAKKILSKTGAPQFMGSGFYATDYQHKS
jgi:predicted nucleic acid-binding Zn ribbon protein